MKILIVYHSSHHQNTEKIALAMAQAVGADVRKVTEVKPDAVLDYDLIGFGSGIFYFRHHILLMQFADQLPVLNKKVFIFSTSGRGIVGNFHHILKERLISRGGHVIGEFACKGFDSFGVFKLFGGINRHHPDEKDLKEAVNFIHSLQEQPD